MIKARYVILISMEHDMSFKTIIQKTVISSFSNEINEKIKVSEDIISNLRKLVSNLVDQINDLHKENESLKERLKQYEQPKQEAKQ